MDKIYHVIDRQTGYTVGRAATLKGARRIVDRKDNEYGGYKHFIRNMSAGKNEL